MQGESEQADTHSNLAQQLMQAGRLGYAEHKHEHRRTGIEAWLSVLCWPTRPYLMCPRWQGQTAHKVASLRRPPQHKGLRPAIEGPCIGSSSRVDLGKAPILLSIKGAEHLTDN